MMKLPGRQHKNNCQQIQGMISPYIDGRLSSIERDSVKYHVEVCRDCQHELDSLQATVQLLHAMPSVVAPRSFALSSAYARQTHSKSGTSLVNWLRGLSATASTNRLKMASAAAAVLLIAVVAGDVTGALYTEETSGALNAAKTETAVKENAPASESVIATEVDESGTTAVTAQEPTLDGESPIAEARQLNEPDPDAPPSSIGSFQVENGARDGGPPPHPSLAPSLEETDSIADAQQAPLPVSDQEPHDRAYPWLRPVEIALIALLGILAATHLISRQRKSSFSF